MPQLLHVRPGTRFRLAEMPEITGVLITATECRAFVRLDRPVQDVEFTDTEGNTRRFQTRRAHVTSMASVAVVEAIGFQPLMKRRTTCRRPEPRRRRPRRAAN